MLSNYFIFENPKEIEYIAFRKKCLTHNREMSIFLSIAILCIYLVLHLIWLLFDLPSETPQLHYLNKNLRIIAISALVVIFYNKVYFKYKFLQKEGFIQTLIILLCLVMLGTSGINSYVFSSNPRNNLTPVLISAIAVSSLFRFNVRESFLVFISGFLLFIFLYLFWFDKQESIALNLSIIFNIYILAFLVNRSVLSNAYRYFKQLKMTESINITLKNVIQQKDEVLAIVAHDLRGPINNIKHLSTLITEEKNTSAETSNLNSLILESCDAAELIINDLIAISKVKNASEPIETVCLNDVIHNIHQSTILNHQQREIKFIDSTKNLYSTVYPDKLKRIIQNLLSNALKFTPENKKIELKLYDANGSNFLEINDDGIGVDESKQSQLFKKYSSASQKGLKGEESVGLGLYIVKELTEMMNGQIEYQRKNQGGSRFILKFPKA